YFAQLRKVTACTTMRDAADRSGCFALLTFDDPAIVNAFMVREHLLDEKLVSYLVLLSIVTYPHPPQIDPMRGIPRQEYQRHEPVHRRASTQGRRIFSGVVIGFLRWIEHLYVYRLGGRILCIPFANFHIVFMSAPDFLEKQKFPC
ncbi:hypothetical protein B0H14DRAFT_2345740, partial [Mycena olivaceomarginata]